MPHVVTQSCCNDASCVYACPVNCIHPTPDEPDFGMAEMLHIDPVSCVDCGACVSACPTGAIVRDTKLLPEQRRYVSINADFYAEPRDYDLIARPSPAPSFVSEEGMLRVAIVGSGPSAMYAADELLIQKTGRQRRVQVDMFERLSTPYGLVRFGVAPDHTETKGVTRFFDLVAAQDGFTFHPNVEVGKDVSLAELRRRYHAVIYAVGAATDRKLAVPGAELPGVASATDFVAWYNGHPDQAGRDYDLSGGRAVIIGNGNVALDVARILTTDPRSLADTTISRTALESLRHSKIEEVLIVGRRSMAQSAFTVGEFAGLLAVPEVDVVVGTAEMALDAGTQQRQQAGALDHTTVQKLRLLQEANARAVARGDHRRIVFRYRLSPTRMIGTERVSGVEFAHTELSVAADGRVLATQVEQTELVDAGLVLSSIGYHGVPVAGLPFDAVAGVVPNDGGRVLPGVYVTGWIKRGPTGFIGTNKSCAQETVRGLVDDFNAGALSFG